MHWKITKEGIVLPIKVVPKASKSEIVDWEGNELKVRLSAVPEKGEANKELIKTLSKALKIPKSQISILNGETSRHKNVLLHTLNEFLLESLPTCHCH